MIVMSMIRKTKNLFFPNNNNSISSNIVIWQTYSALFILRSITKYFIEIDSEQNLYPYFLAQDNSGRFFHTKKKILLFLAFRSNIINELFC
jgi:hypothetical protein